MCQNPKPQASKPQPKAKSKSQTQRTKPPNPQPQASRSRVHKRVGGTPKGLQFHLRYLRLGYFGRLVAVGSVFLHRMLEYLAPSHNSFIKLIVNDLKWFFTAEDYVRTLPHINDGLQGIASWIFDNPVLWVRSLKRHKKAFTAWFSLDQFGQAWEK